MEATLNKLLSSLEAVAARLERVESQLASGAGAGAGASSASGGASAATVEEFKELAQENLAKYYEVSKTFGGKVAEQAELVRQLVDAHTNLLGLAATSAKPSDEEFMKLFTPHVELSSKITALRDSSRSDARFPHLSAVSEGAPAFGWVSVPKTPSKYALEYRGNAEFYLNRLIRDFKGKDETEMAWVTAWGGFLKALEEYIKKNFTTGLVWKGTGNAAAAAAAKPAAAAAPAAASKPATSAAPTAAVGASLFAELNKKGDGGNLTSGFRKVTDDMKAKNRPESEKTSVVPASAAKTPAPSKFGGNKKMGPPKFELAGNKWMVENQENNKSLVISDCKLNQAVYVFGCTGSVIQIQGKINSICLDSCKKTSVVFPDLVSSFEAVNCNSVEIQCTGKAHNFTIDKCSGVQIFLSKDGLDCEIITAKSDAMNVLIPGADEDADLIELPIAEQFKTSVVNGKLVTGPVEHV